MNSFELYNPTRIFFGTDSYTKLASQIPAKAKILMTYGGGSIKSNGVYDAVMKALTGHQVIEFGGIEPNPTLQTLTKALEIIKTEQIDFLLAVGGGSVIDGTKFLAAAALYNGNPWDILEKRIRTEEGRALPFGTVLTLPATGSEMNSGAVVSNTETGEKLGMGGPGLFPKFSCLNPEVVKSIPKNQLRNGLVDSYTHVLEQYLTYPIQARLQDRLAESILETIIEISKDLIYQPYNESIASDYMWCCTMALNGLIQKGVPTDWTTHMIGHELTAQYHIDHAMTLAIIFPNLWKHQFENKKEKLAQYGQRVFNIPFTTVDETAQKAIDKTLEFLHSIEVKTQLSQYTDNYEMTAENIQRTFEARNWNALGERQAITPKDVYEIVKMSY